MEDGMSLWDRFNHSYCECPSIELSLDISRIDFDEGFMAKMRWREVRLPILMKIEWSATIGFALQTFRQPLKLEQKFAKP